MKDLGPQPWDDSKTDWTKIAESVDDKTPLQCRTRWRHCFARSLPWGHEEKLELEHYCRLYPNQWAIIARMMKRPEIQCRNQHRKIQIWDRFDVPDDGPELTIWEEQNGYAPGCWDWDDEFYPKDE
jgi:hypothetical protein